MTDKAIIQGSLVDVRNVNQHKCVRMLIDVPAELAPKVMEAFGWPTMAAPVPVAIARLQEPAKSATPVQDGMAKGHYPGNAPKRAWPDMPKSQQAGIACEDPEFRKYLAETSYGNLPSMDVAMAADAVRARCGVGSRATLDVSQSAGQKWDKLYSDYQLWKRGCAA